MEIWLIVKEILMKKVWSLNLIRERDRDKVKVDMEVESITVVIAHPLAKWSRIIKITLRIILEVLKKLLRSSILTLQNCLLLTRRK